MKRRWMLAVAMLSPSAAHAQPAPKPVDEVPRAHGVAGDPPPAQAAERVLTCEGLFGPKATHAKLTEAFGAKNVSYDKMDDGAEGETYMATVLFKKVPAERLVIIWADAKRQQKPDGITAKSYLPPGSNWHLSNGLHAGSSLENVEKANGKPFAMSGFEWDYGGYATDWKGGTLAKPIDGCNISIRFNPAKGAKTDGVSGDKTILSSDPKMKAAKPFVSSVTVSPK